MEPNGLPDIPDDAPLLVIPLTQKNRFRRHVATETASTACPTPEPQPSPSQQPTQDQLYKQLLTNKVQNNLI